MAAPTGRAEGAWVDGGGFPRQVAASTSAVCFVKALEDSILYFAPGTSQRYLEFP